MLETVLLSAAGGFAYQIFPFIEGLRDGKTIPSQFNDAHIVIILAYTALGALLGYIYFNEDSPLSKIVAFHIGASAPMILKTLGNIVKPEPK